MPGKHINEDPSGQRRVCKRCSLLEASIVVRTEPLCRDCFIKYVHTKVIKRMEAFRVRHATYGLQRNLLLPLSLGVSSLTLLHILDYQLSRQSERTGRAGYSIHILFIQDPSSEASGNTQSLLDKVKERYPEHGYSVASLPDVLDLEDFPAITDGQLELEYDADKPTKAKLLELLDLLPSATSRADVLSILRTRTIVKLAKEKECEAILWGDSTTRLAERTLAETAKGRGFSLPWQVADGMSPYGIAFHFPMRDLLKKELLSHADMVSPPLTPLLIERSSKPSSASLKNTTIDDLMTQYFESVEESYPSIVANVVRTSGKLKAPAVEENTKLCKLCGMPVVDEAFGIHGWGGDQSMIDRSGKEALCYGCTRAVPQPAIVRNEEDQDR